MDALLECDLCGLKETDEEKVDKQTECCKRNCHEKCAAICPEFLWNCPLCRKKIGEYFRFRIEWGNAFSFSEQASRLERIREKCFPRSPLFGRTISFCIPRDGSLDAMAFSEREKRDRLAKEMSDLMWQDE